MDIQINLRRGDFEAMHPTAKLLNFDAEKMVYFGDKSESINSQWSTWCACIGMQYLEVKEAQKVAVPEWISVDDWLPEFEQEVLLLSSGRERLIGQYLPATANEFGTHFDEGFWINGGASIVLSATHWMPILDLPEAQEQN